MECIMAKSICLFNHKGGVSKTTTTFNLGWSMATLGKKVIIVDLDSQCNLSGLVLGYEAIDGDFMSAFYDNENNLTMKQIVKSIIDGEPAEYFLNKIKSKKLHHTKNANLELLPGHLDVADLDSQISVSLKIASGVPATKNTPGNLPKILTEIAKRENVDYILYDLSPNVGGLNEIILMSSDYFLVPTSPDYFCLQAITSLQKNIVKWHSEINTFMVENKFEKKDFPIHNQPLFLGAIHQRYRPRYEKPAQSFQKWITNITDSVTNNLVPALKSINCLSNIHLQQKIAKGRDSEPYNLAQISDFNSLIAISQQVAKPIFSLTDDEIRTVGKVFGHAENTMIASRNAFKDIFQELSNNIIKLTS